VLMDGATAGTEGCSPMYWLGFSVIQYLATHCAICGGNMMRMNSIAFTATADQLFVVMKRPSRELH
jgi:hypothetical protein